MVVVFRDLGSDARVVEKVRVPLIPDKAHRIGGRMTG